MNLVRVTYRFEEVQELTFKLYDIDSSMHSRHEAVDVGSQDFIGQIECQLAAVMGSRGCTFTGRVANPMHASRSVGTLTVRGEEVQNANGLINILLAAEGLENKVRRCVVLCMGAVPCL